MKHRENKNYKGHLRGSPLPDFATVHHRTGVAMICLGLPIFNVQGISRSLGGSICLLALIQRGIWGDQRAWILIDLRFGSCVSCAGRIHTSNNYEVHLRGKPLTDKFMCVFSMR